MKVKKIGGFVWVYDLIDEKEVPKIVFADTDFTIVPQIQGGTFNGIQLNDSSDPLKTVILLAGTLDGDDNVLSADELMGYVSLMRFDPTSSFETEFFESNLNIAKFKKPVKYFELFQGELDALTSVEVGSKAWNKTYQRDEYYDSFFGWTPVSMSNGSARDWGYEYFTEIVATNGEPWNIVFTNGGTAVNSTLPLLSPTSLYGFSTGVTANGDSQIRSGSYFRASSGKRRAEAKVCVSILSTPTERFHCVFGWVGATGALDQTNGIYFLSDEAGASTDGSASPNWQCVCANGGWRTFVVTSVPVANQTTLSLQKLRIDDSGTGNEVKFYIDDVLVATITTNIPNSSSVALASISRITKTVGTSTRNFYVDYMYIKERFNTPR